MFAGWHRRLIRSGGPVIASRDGALQVRDVLLDLLYEPDIDIGGI